MQDIDMALSDSRVAEVAFGGVWGSSRGHGSRGCSFYSTSPSSRRANWRLDLLHLS